MSLSEKTGANVCLLNSRACTQSLKFDTTRILRRLPVDDVAAGQRGERAEARDAAQERSSRPLRHELRRIFDQEARIDTGRRLARTRHHLLLQLSARRSSLGGFLAR